MFSRLIGNETIKTTLRRFLANARVPNAMLFAGDEGVGKREFAFELARAFICTDTSEGEACGVCAACLRIDTFVFPEPTDKTKDDYKKVFFGGHSDVGTAVPYKRNILIDAIRDLEKQAYFRPYEAGARFFIIDQADKMNDEASNALLKTLEEPAPTSHIFLITSRPDSLLATIRSRCQMLRFAPIGADEIEKFLIADRAFTSDEARLAARLARGSIGRAVSINVSQFKTRREKMLAVISNVTEGGERAQLLRISEEMNDAKNKDHFEDALDILQSLIHDIWTLSVDGDQTRVVNTDLTETLGAIANNAGAADMPAWINEIDEMRRNFVVNINRKIAADALFVSMAGV